MAKPHVTRTFGPIHFEDLDPHRFEDLIRQLAYDFRPWRSIESTGRGGADDGFDVRAYEEMRISVAPVDDEADPEDVAHPMEGNLWMIQCKREKEIGPKKVASIITDGVTMEAAPYGYVLAAPVHFSKAAHDRFREELRQRGVLEFYLWGAGELEDMLYQPKHDHILFAFFGISLVTKCRSRSVHVRAAFSMKNKLLRILGESPRGQQVLIRDLNDERYPYEDEYSDFAENPRWKLYAVESLHPLGLIVTTARYFAYLNTHDKVWDYTDAIEGDRSHSGLHDQSDEGTDTKRLAVRGVWEAFPRAHRATLVRRRMIRYDRIECIDEKGDSEFKFPHLYVGFELQNGPFAGLHEYLGINEYTQHELDGLTRNTVFPIEFPLPAFGVIHGDKPLAIDEVTRSMLRHGRREITLYSVGKQYNYLKPTDVVPVEAGASSTSEKIFLKITNIRKLKAAIVLEDINQRISEKADLERQIGRELRISDKPTVVEVVTIYEWQLERDRPIV